MNTTGLDEVIENAQALAAIVSSLCMAGVVVVVVGAVFGITGVAWLVVAVGVVAGVGCGYLSGRRLSELKEGKPNDC